MCDQHAPINTSTESSTATSENLPEHPLLDTLTISERKIHRTCLKAHLLGNAARLRFLRGLRAAAETRLYIKLGYPTVHQYAKDQFQCENTQAHEFLRMAKLLEKLPLMTKEYEKGRLSWSAFEVMSRVPKIKGKERQWIEFAQGKSIAQIKDEVQRAIEENRRTPREDGYALRNRLVRMIFELTLDEHDKLLKAFLKLARELEPSLRGRRLQPKELLMYLVERILETDPAGTPRGRVEREDSLYKPPPWGTEGGKRCSTTSAAPAARSTSSLRMGRWRCRRR